MRELLKPLNFLRRKINGLVDKHYTEKKLKKRRGKCKKCGRCCAGCIYLDKKTNLCKTYNNRPFLCYKNFPLDKIDQKIWGIEDCGYSFG